MSSFDLILSGARVLSSGGDAVTDVGLRDGLIAAIGDLDTADGPRKDCRGKVLTPGGVDPHAHIEQMSGMGLMNADTFETATASAVMGGTTSVISFAAQAKGQRLADAMADYEKRAARGALIDHAFHIIISDLSVSSAQQDLRSLIRAGHRSVKLFTTYSIKLDDRSICEVLSIAREEGALVCVHAESDGLIGWTKDRLVSAGKTAPRYHAVSHPRLAELEAVNRLISFAEFFATPVMLFHISTSEGVAAVRAAKARGVPIWAETCPHYLFMDETVLDRPGLEGAKWMCSPPQRTVADQEALWIGLADGTLSLVSSDHAPYRFDESGKLAAGKSPDFPNIANGLPGLEVRLPLLFDAIVSQGRLPAHDFVRLTATEPARIYGFTGKGDIAAGMHADLVVWDPRRKVTFGADDLHDNVGYNPWEGREIMGWPETVYRRGDPVVDCGQLLCKGAIGNGLTTGNWLNRHEIGVCATREPAKEYSEACTGLNHHQ